MNKFYNDLKAGLEEAIFHKKGKINLRSEEVDIQSRLPNIKRKKLNILQGILKWINPF